MAEEDDDQIEALNQALVRTQAMYFALESLCLSIVNALPNKPDVLVRFQAHRDRLEVGTLFDAQTPDDVFHETVQAHANIAGLLSPSRKQS
jgi:hypothetical protein